MSILRTHYSQTPIEALRAVEQPEQIPPHMKPGGLWYGIDGEWRDWCASEMPHWIENRFLYAIHLGAERLLRLTTLAELDQFQATYARLLFPATSICGIDWRTVADKFDGIEIAPYQYERRLELGFLWYYGWDCASGCIWRPNGMRLELIESARTPALQPA